MLNSIDKNRGTHGVSSFMLGRLLPSRENLTDKSEGSVKMDIIRVGWLALFAKRMLINRT